MTKQERAALTLVNKIRKAQGRKPCKRLPKGVPEAEYECPIARALDHGHVGVGDGDSLQVPAKQLAAYLAAGLIPEDDMIPLRMPKSFDRFVSWFDAQKSPAAKALNVQPETGEEEQL